MSDVIHNACHMMMDTIDDIIIGASQPHITVVYVNFVSLSVCRSVSKYGVPIAALKMCFVYLFISLRLISRQNLRSKFIDC